MGSAVELRIWVVHMKILAIHLCQTVCFSVAINTCFELLVHPDAAKVSITRFNVKKYCYNKEIIN